MINKIFILIAFIILLTSKNSWAGEVSSVITESNQLKIQFTEKPDFKVIPQDDPFKLKIEVSNSKTGVLSKKMLFHEGLISEVSAQPSSKGLILDILFSEPIKAEISSQGTLILISYGGGQKEISEKSKIVDITFEKNDEGYEIYLKGDNTLPEPEVFKDGNTLNLTFSGINLATEIPKNLPMKLRKKDDEITISLFLSKDSEAEVFYLGDEVLIDVKGTLKKEELKISTKDVALAQNSPKSTPKAEKMEISSPKLPDSQKTISLDLQDADIVGALILIGELSGYNMVIHPDVKGKITLKLKDVPWTKVLDIICKTFYLEKVFDDNIIRVAPIKVFQEEKRLIAESRELFKKAEDTDTRIIKLRYASPDKVKAAIEGAKLLSPQGNIVIDDRTRSIIIKDIPDVLKNVEKFIANLDKATKQILLEAKIVEIKSDFSKSIGFEWGVSWFPHSTTSIIGSQGGGTIAPIAINLPASTGSTGPSTAFTLGYLNRAGTLALSLRVSALQESGKGKLISNPRVITMNNQKAKIVQGESIPYGELDVQSGKISTKFKDVAITIETTPNLIDDKSMQLDLNIVKEDLIGFVNIGGVQAPYTAKIESSTKVTLNNGETVVIGGIYKMKDSISDSKVPFVSDIPLIGEFFKKSAREENIYEVMIFITPKIIDLE